MSIDKAREEEVTVYEKGYGPMDGDEHILRVERRPAPAGMRKPEDGGTWETTEEVEAIIRDFDKAIATIAERDRRIAAERVLTVHGGQVESDGTRTALIEWPADWPLVVNGKISALLSGRQDTGGSDG